MGESESDVMYFLFVHNYRLSIYSHPYQYQQSLPITTLSHPNTLSTAYNQNDELLIKEMLKDSPGSLNFTMYLALLGELLHVYSASSQASPSELLKAFETIERGGRIGKERLREVLGGGVERLSGEEVEIVLQEAPTGEGEEMMIDYREFVKQLKAPF